MKRLAALAFIFGVLAAPIPGFADQPLTNASVIQLKHGGLDNASIVTIVQQRSGHYDLSPSGIATLKKAGIGDDVIAAMKATMAPPPAAKPAGGATAQSDGQVHVFYLAPSGRTELKKGEVAAAMVDPYKPGLFQFAPPTTISTHLQFGLKGAHANLTTPASPVFEMDTGGSYMIDPAHFEAVILQLRTNGDQRVVGTQTSNTNVRTTTTTTDPIVDVRVPAKVDKIAPGRFRITPAQPLSPGEYGVAMRDPDVQPETINSSAPAASQTQGMSKQQVYQDIVWDFSVQP